MAKENTGEIYVEIRAKLDNFQVDIRKASTVLKTIENQAAKTGNEATNSFSGMGKNIGKTLSALSNSSVNQFAKMAKSISAAFKALPVIGLLTTVAEAITKLVNGISEYLNKTADAYFRQQKELTTLNAIVQTTGASAWTTSAQLQTMADNLSKATGYAKNDITQMQSKILTYTNITGDNFDRTSKAAIDMASVMGIDLTSAAETLGKALNSPTEGLTALTGQGFRFKDGLKEQITLMTEHGNIAEAQALILNEVENVYQGVASAQNNVVNKSERLKQVQEELNAEIGRSTSGFTNFVAGIKLSWKEAQLFELRQKRMGESVKANEARIQSYKTNIDTLKESLDELIANGVSDERIISIRVQIQDAENAMNALINDAAEAQKSVDYYTKEMQSPEVVRKMHEVNEWMRERNAIMKLSRDLQRQINETTDENNKDLLTQRQRMIETPIAELDAKIQAGRVIIGQTEEQLANAQRRLNMAVLGQRVEEENQRIVQRRTAATLALKTLEDAVTDATEKRRLAILAAGVAQSNGRITMEELHQQTMQAYTEEANQLTTLRQQIREVTLAGNGENEDLRTAALDKVNAALSTSITLERQRRQVLADIELKRVNEDLQDQLIRLKGSQEEIIALERRRAWEAIENSDDYKNASKRLRDEIKENFNALKDAEQKTDPSEKFDKMKENIQKYGTEIGNIMNGFMSFRAALIKKEVEEELKALEKLYNAKLEYLEKEKQAKLYEKGFIEAQTEEQHQRELELAIESGDQQRIYAAHNAHERFLIEDEFAKAKEALDIETETKRKDLEHKSAMAQWQAQILQGMVNAAMATLGTLASPPYPPLNLPLVAATAAMGAAQVAVVSANKPKLQTFAEGGIVSGNSFSGDKILTRQNSREMDLNMRQQKNLFNAIDGNSLGGGQTITIIVPVNLDGREIARNSVTHINNRSAGLINRGSILQ